MAQDEARPDTLAAVLAQLTAEFDAAMPGRIAALRGSLHDAREQEPGSEDRLVDGLHRLAGNAGTFGHADISFRARALEGTLDAARATTSSPSEAPDLGAVLGAVLDAVDRFVDDLSAEFPAPA